MRIDKKKDLMLLTSHDRKGLQIAKSVEPHQHVHTITHGGGKPSYRTDGELLTEEDIMMPVGEVKDQKDMDNCAKDGGKFVTVMFWVICMQPRHVMSGTALVIPGSSGGPVLNDDGQLVGIVSATDQVFYFYTTLDQIHEFLEGL